MLGVFLLPAFTRLGHECQDIFSLCDEMHVHRLDLHLYSHLSFVGIESKPMATTRENPLNQKNSPQRRIEPTTLHQAEQ